MTPLDYSPFLQRFAAKQADVEAWLESLAAPPPTTQTLEGHWQTLIDQPTLAFEQAARRFRQDIQAGMIYRLLAGLDGFEDTVATTTAFAETALEASLAHHWPLTEQAFGAPADRRFAVVGMGKLGGRELNLSSDIDIFCVFGSDGETSGPRVRDHGDFFTRLTQAMAKSLDAVTADGFVARVDQRLRPWGNAGRLAIPVAACESYYETHGREWERFALVKARPVAGDLELGQSLLGALRPFVYRKYLDFGVFESIRDLKAKIEAEVRRAGRDTNVKVGRGGIREIEFIVQSMQLLRGGQIPSLQVSGFLKALAGLVDAQLLAPAEAATLREDYVWLRQVEHVIQAHNDQQTQALPNDVGPLAAMLGHATAADFERMRAEVTGRVHEAFSNFLRVEAAVQDPRPIDPEVAALLQHTREDPSCERLEPIARGRLLKLLGQLAPELSAYPIGVTERTLAFVKSCVRRSAYLALLSENPGTRARMLALIDRSSWVTERLIEMPALLDELLMLSADDALMSREALHSELTVRLQRVDPEDSERLIETLVQFARGMAFRVAVFEVFDEIPLMRVSDQLTWIAEVCVGALLDHAYAENAAKHGLPKRSSGVPDAMGLAVLGYGKLGGLEMSYGSDLDLVFVHAVDPVALTDGARPVEGAVFVNRVVRRVIALCETNTRFGKLYEIDTRLRPSGRSGFLVVDLDALSKYLDESAWTWELQAFVRARPVAGDSALAAALKLLRRRVLQSPRDPVQLRLDVIQMREKMAEHLGSTGTDAGFDLKHDRGGIVDLEFMVQYFVLAAAEAHPDLCDFTDNVRLLDALVGAECIDAEAAAELKAAYLRFRRLGHEAMLAGRDGRVDPQRVSAERALVSRYWAQWMKTV